MTREPTISEKLVAAGFTHASDERARHGQHSVYGPCGEWLGSFAALDASAALQSGDLAARLRAARQKGGGRCRAEAGARADINDRDTLARSGIL